MKPFLTVILILLLTSNCKKGIFVDDELTLNKQPVLDCQIEIDGYYYSKFGEIVRIYFIYNDGTVLSGGDIYENKLFEQEQNYLNGKFIEKYKENKLFYGICNIEGEQIKIEKWYPSSGGGLPVFLHAGRITNDTTFVITKSVRPKTGEEKELNEIYRFKRFSPKPDSTNSFIK